MAKRITRKGWSAETCCRSCVHCLNREGWKGKKCSFDQRSMSIEGVFVSCRTCKNWELSDVDEMTIDFLSCAPMPMTNKMFNVGEFTISEDTKFCPDEKEFPMVDIIANENVCRGCEKLSRVVSAWEYFEDHEMSVIINGEQVESSYRGSRRVCVGCPMITEHIVLQEE